MTISSEWFWGLVITSLMAFLGVAWKIYQDVMTELKAQTVTLTILGERSNLMNVLAERVDKIDERVTAVERWRNKQSGILEAEEKSKGGFKPYGK